MSNDRLDKIIESLQDLTTRMKLIEEMLENLKTHKPKEIEVMRSEKEESFMEFFKKSYSKKETDKTLVIMHFLESRRGMKDINTRHISEAYKEIREKAPSNVADKIQMLHKKGLIMPGEVINNLNGWRITRSGLEYLEELENGNKK